MLPHPIFFSIEFVPFKMKTEVTETRHTMFTSSKTAVAAYFPPVPTDGDSRYSPQ